MSDPIIAASGLTRRFGDTLAVAELTLEVRRGEVFGFLGHNGAGKTTTVRLLNGVLTPSAVRRACWAWTPWPTAPRCAARPAC